MFGRLASMVRSSAAPTPAVVGGVVAPTYDQISSILGPPPNRLDPTRDHIRAQVFAPPWIGPHDLDRYGGETPEMRRLYRDVHRTSGTARAAIDGKSDDISSLKVTVQSADKDNPLCNEAAEFLDWTVTNSADGWAGLIENIYRPATIDGWSLCEKRMKPVRWKGREMWGFAHARSLDTTHLRLQIDVYRNVVGIVNMLLGAEFYDPDQVIHYVHRGMFANPFGQSDMRAVLFSAEQIREVYMTWYVAQKVYSLPYMVGKTTPQLRQQMEATLKALRGGGWAVLTDEKDAIEAVDMATSAAVNGFEPLIRTHREEIFYAVRHASLPFMEGKGSSGAHGDTEVEQGTSDAGEKRDADRVANVIRHQLVPWLIGANFPLDEGQYPIVQFGGTNWKQIKEIVGVVREAQEAGVEPSAKWVHTATGIPTPTDDQDVLTTADERKEKQQLAQQQQQGAGGGGNPLAALAGGGGQPQSAPQPEPKQEQPAQTFSDSHRPESRADQVGRLVEQWLAGAAS